MDFKRKRLGFTLTEIMVAMTILGVIVALTVPGLSRDYTRREFQTAISKFYADMMQVGPLAQVTIGSNNLANSVLFTDGNFNCTNISANNEGHWPKLFLSSTCRGANVMGPANGKTNGFADKYRSIDGKSTMTLTEFNEKFPHSLTYVLDGGQVICFKRMKYNYNGSQKVYQEIYIDINGSKSPNIAGLDFFKLHMQLSDSDGDVYEVYSGSKPEADCISHVDATGCFTSVMNNNFKIKYY